MNCKNCNSLLAEGATFCPNCGQPVVAETPATPVTTEPVVNAEPEVLETEKVVSEVTQPIPDPTPIQPAPAYTSTSTTEQKKSSNVGLIVVIIILALLVLGLGGFIAYKFLLPNTPTPEPELEPISTPTTPTTPTAPEEKEYMVVGNSTLGYLKLPGKWTAVKVPGAAETALQYVDDATVANTAKGAYIVTLNVWKETPDATTAKYAADQEASYYSANDPDATNIQVELVKLGSYDAYKLSTQYRSDNVWVITWYLDGADGLVHIIQVEGLDLTNDNFKIPETFSFTEIK